MPKKNLSVKAKELRILLVHNIFSIVGGDGFFFHETARVLKLNGHEVAYFCVHQENEPEGEWNKYFGKYTDYNKKPLLQSITAFPGMVYSFYNKRKFKKLLEDFEPDLVHFFSIHSKITPSVLDMCKNKGVPAVISCNDYKHICPNYKLYHHGHDCLDCMSGNYFNVIKNRCSKDSIVWSTAHALEAFVNNTILNIYKKNIDLFLFSSDFMTDITKSFWKTENVRYGKLTNPFNSPSYPISEDSEDYFIYFGRIIEEKGVDLLLKEMASVPKKMKLIIIGDGPDLNKCLQLKKELKLDHVEFVGPKWGDELTKYLKLTRFVVVPSLWNENFPYVILQSFAYGKPVIGSKRGGIPELVKHNKFGKLFDISKPGELSEHIIELWENPSKTSLWGKNAKKWADATFNDSSYYEQLIKNYKVVAG